MDNRQVIEMLRNKFEARAKSQTYVMNAEDKKAYNIALENGDVQTALAIKSGMATRRKLSEQFNAELEDINIKAVSKELDTIVPCIEEINKAINSKYEQLEQNIKEEFCREEQQLSRRGIFKGSRLHIMLQDKYVNKLNAIDEHEDVQELKSQLFSLQERKKQLKYMQEQYKEQNADIINELKREQVKKNLQELGLVD